MSRYKAKSNISIIIAIIVLVALVGLTLLYQRERGGQSLTKVILAEAMQPICSPVYIAAEKGYFREEGLDVQLVPFAKGKLCLDAVLGDKADMGTVAETPLMHLGFQKQPVAILCTMHYATKNTKCVARDDKGVHEPHDLKGHVIGVPIGGNAEYFMDKFLEKYNLTRKDVKIINLNPPEMVGALVRGDIDASFSWEPNISRSLSQLGDKGRVFFGEDLYRETFNLVCMKGWADKNTDTCTKVLRALRKAVEFIRANKDESVKIVANHIQIEEKELDNIWHYYTFEIVMDQFLMDSLVDQAQWAISTGIHEGPVPDYRYMFYPNPLRSVGKESVSIDF